MQSEMFSVRVGGEFACFSRPEFKVERVSYLVMTPSAARGLLEAIFWKPEFAWQVRQIAVLRPIKQFALLRNELASRQGETPIFVEAPRQRQQRSALILRDVEYLIQAEMILRPHASAPIAKYAEQFRRRLAKGQCHHTPYLGCREFAAWFEPARGDETPVPLDLDLGAMLLDIAYRPDPKRQELSFHRHGAKGATVAKGYAEARFFRAHLQQGVLHVPPEMYEGLYPGEDGHA